MTYSSVFSVHRSGIMFIAQIQVLHKDLHKGSAVIGTFQAAFKMSLSVFQMCRLFVFFGSQYAAQAGLAVILNRTLQKSEPWSGHTLLFKRNKRLLWFK